MLLNASSLGPRWPLNQSRSSLWLNTTIFKHKAPLSFMFLQTFELMLHPIEKKAHQDLDMENTHVQLTLLSNARGPVNPPLVDCFIYISCGRKWGKGRANTTSQLSAKPHSFFLVLTQSSEYFLHQLIVLQNPSFPLPLRLCPMPGTTVMTFALGSSNKPS